MFVYEQSIQRPQNMKSPEENVCFQLSRDIVSQVYIVSYVYDDLPECIEF